MADIVKNPKETQYEKQTYNLIAKENADFKFYHCEKCGLEVLEGGYLCMTHKCLFCKDHGEGHDNKSISCNGITRGNPVFSNKDGEMPCILVPIKKVILVLR